MDTEAPERPGPAAAPIPDGTVARSVFFLRHACALTRADRALPLIALAGLVCNALATAAIFGLGVWLLDGAVLSRGTPLLIVAGVPGTFLSTYFNVALLWLAQERLEGRPRRARDAFAAANRRLGRILAWSLLAVGVGAALDWIAEKVPIGGAIASWALGVAWSVATMFALPVLALEDAGARRAAKRSAEIFRARWGEGLTGDVALGAFALFVAFPGIVLVFAGIAVCGVVGVVLAVVGGLLFGGGIALTGALRELYALAIYRHQVLGATSFGLEPSQLDAFATLTPGRGWR